MFVLDMLNDMQEGTKVLGRVTYSESASYTHEINYQCAFFLVWSVAVTYRG